MPNLTEQQLSVLAALEFTGKIFQGMVAEERKKQNSKWGDQSRHTRLYWLGILVEEVGEFSKAVIENNGVAAERELIQVAAVCQAAFEYRFKELGHA